MGKGVKLAFVIPAISTFFAAQAAAANSNVTCRSPGQPCTVDSDCCGTAICSGTNKCAAL